MPDRDHPGLHLDKVYTGPDGNRSVHMVSFKETTIEGSGALAANDRFFLAPLPRGMRILDIDVLVHDAGTANVTARFGTHQKGGGDWTDDDDYFLGDTAMGAVAEFSSRATKHHPPLFIDEPNVFLTARFDGADNAAELELSILIDYVYEGNL